MENDGVFNMICSQIITMEFIELGNIGDCIIRTSCEINYVLLMPNVFEFGELELLILVVKLRHLSVGY